MPTLAERSIAPPEHTRSGNFAFLEAFDAQLRDFADQAESFCLWDPCASLFKLRLYVERLARLTAESVFPHWTYREDLFKLLQRLEGCGAFGPEVGRSFHRIRKVANTAVHHGLASREEALGALRLAHGLAVWLARSHGQFQGPDSAPAFQEPRERSYGVSANISAAPAADWQARARALEEQVRLSREETAELAKLRELAETAAAIAQVRLDEAGRWAEEMGAADLLSLVGKPAPPAAIALPALQARPAVEEVAPLNAREELRREIAETFALRCREAEARLAHEAMEVMEARWLVLQELAEAGWVLPPEGARTYEEGARPHPGLDQALLEWPTYAGPADIVLFRGTTPAAILLLRPRLRELEPALEEAAACSRGWLFQPGETSPPGAPWRMHRVRWALATNGHAIQAGGLRARDLSRDDQRTHTPQAWPKPSQAA